MSKEIKLTRDKITIVDDEDFDLLLKYKWVCRDSGSNGQYIYAYNRKKKILMHRLLLNAKNGEFVDHINHDTLDNRKENLRFCNKQSNSFNSRPNIKRKDEYEEALSYKGVWWDKTKEKWRACLWVKGKKFYNGHHNNVEDAAEAYNEIALKHHGEYSVLNNVQRTKEFL